ncbi:hypothetical protein B9Z65_62 [Elsinoe australis]|uniref:Major facilitator superfamily (MFS) profile domain-containing protein n=1 Tax=Elsinoe australis TaxID=40998 RepID=A0A2P7ZKB7_9PEZI|nr:hypothetical protein B9Z65_62 [Elsinoe australis]
MEKNASDHREYEANSLENVPTIQPMPEGLKSEAGVVLDISGKTDSSLKLAGDGHTILLPQPTDDPNDPLNWSWRKKHAILFIVAWGALCADFTSAAGTAVIFLQAEEWQISIFDANQPNALNVLFMALGGLIWVPMTSFFGRAPTLWWSTVGGFVFCIASAVSPYFSTHYAMRCLTGLFITSGQTIALAFIKDLFYFHERARKIGLWAALYISSPYLGPLFANFMVATLGDWRPVFWLCAGVCGLQMLLILLFLDETWYNRDLHSSSHPARPATLSGRISRIIGIWELRHHKTYYEPILVSFRRFALTITKPALILILISYLLIFMWSIGINITTAILFATPAQFGGYGYSSLGLGYLYFTPIVATLLGEIFGHFFNDFLARRYTRRHKGVFEPEARLPIIYVAGVFLVPGLVLAGQALYRRLHVSALIFGWGMYMFGIMCTSVSVSSYVLDAYPTRPAEVAGWTNFARAIGGFGVGYFQQPWGQAIGYDASFGVQAAITGVAVLAVVGVQRYGRGLRIRAGPID